MQISLSGVSYSYPGSIRPVISGASVVFPEGWTALLGDNGCGKTTLVKLACGLLKPDAGSVSSGAYSAYCPQETDDAPEALYDFAASYDRSARELRETLGLDESMAWRYDELSCGERKKLQVAVALWQEPDALILDEPTNHLDIDARRALTVALARFSGIGILVSHDRELLEALAVRCVSFERGGLVVRNGRFSDAMAQAGIERAARANERAAAKRELARLSSEKANRAQEASRADARKSKRRIDPKDHDAKEKINLAIYTGQDGARGKISAQMDARLAEAKRRVDGAFVEKRYDGDVWLDAEPSPRKVLVRVAACSIPCGQGELALPDLFVGNTDHIGIVGPNGAGKSTLLGYLRTLIASDIVTLDIPQEIDQAQRAEIIGRVQRLGAGERGRVLSAVAQLNSDPDRILEGATASPGELRKLMLALGMLARPVLVIMDEPTNHLDLHSVEALERTLAAYPGALLLVSHDRAFLRACCERTWEVRGGAVREIREG